MAVLQYGAIVTEIKGSLGGHTFKKQGSSFVIQMKSPGFSKSKQLLNPALGYAGFIFQQWIQLPDTSKEAWNNEALLVTFKDKFGNDVSISGRDLFSKLNLQLGVGYYMDVPPPGFTSAVDAFVISNGEFVVSPQSAKVSVIVDSEEFSYFDITAELSVNRLRAPVFRTRQLLKRQILSSNGTINFTNEFFARFAYAASGYFVRYYVTVLNPYGFKGLTQVIELNEGVIAPSYTIVSATVLDNGNSSLIQLDDTDITGYLVNVYALVSASSFPSDNFASSTNLGLFAVDGDNLLDIEDILKVVFPDVTADYYVRFYTVLNVGGNNFGVPQTITTRVLGGVPEYTLTSLDIDGDGDPATFSFEIFGAFPYIFKVYAIADADEIPADDFSSAELIGEVDPSSGSPADIAELLNEAGIILHPGYGVRVYTVLTLSGSPVSDPQTITTTVTGSLVTYTLTSFTLNSLFGSELISYTGNYLPGYSLQVQCLYTDGDTPPDEISESVNVGTFDYESDGTTLMSAVCQTAFPGSVDGDVFRIWTRLLLAGVEQSGYQTITGVVFS